MDYDRRFIEIVAYFWEKHRDPERYSKWDAERCRFLMPSFYEAWTKYKIYDELATLAARELQR